MKETYTSKLYWKKWTHKVVINLGIHDEAFLSRVPKSSRIKRRENQIINLAKKHLGKEYKRLAVFERQWKPMRCSGSTWDRYSNYQYQHGLSLYFNDGDFLELLKSKFSTDITLIERPENSAHEAALLSKEKLVIREKLYYNNYRFVMRLGQTNTQDLRTWLRENLDKLRSRNHSVDYLVSGYWNVSVFFAHPEDAMLFKLSYSNEIVSSDRIKLLSEL